MKQELHYNDSVISFGALAESGFPQLLSSEKFKNSKKIILTDENVSSHWIEFLITSFEALHKAEIIVLPAGEENKDLQVSLQVWEALSEYKVNRTDLIINFGGGVITDMGGFIASTFKRGLSFVNIPTTLLSQVDASVGGKTGIDLGQFKNQIGVFADADYVFIDTQFLKTLPKEELVSGYAEMLKHGLIADASYWKELILIDPVNDQEKLLSLIHHSVKIKRDIVNQDHKETGIRKQLNFGHTIGHAIEGLCLELGTPIPHGNGVAWGMVAETFLAAHNDMVSIQELNEIERVVEQSYPVIQLDESVIPRLMELIQNDKKNSNGLINFTLIETIGQGIHDQTVNNQLIEDAFKFILNREVNPVK